MDDSRKTRGQLLKEIADLRQQVEALKHTNEQLCLSANNNYYAFLDTIEDGYYEIDLNGDFTYVNQALCRSQGYTADELLNRNYRHFIPSHYSKKILDILAHVFQTGRPRRLTDYEFIHKNGEVRYIDLSVTLMSNSQGHPIGFRGLARDRTRERLRELELERYHEFVENVEDGCFETDLNGTLTFINSGMCQIYGYLRKDLLNMNHRILAPPGDVKAIYEIFNQIYRTGAPAQIIDYAIVRKDGSKRNLEVSAALIRDADGNPSGFRGISRDRTEKRVKEQEVERYRIFVEAMQEGVFETDLAGNITFLNDAACRIFGYPPDKLMGMNNRQYSSPETAKRIFRIFNRIYETGLPEEITDYEILREDGQTRYLDMTASLIRNKSGEPVGFRGIYKDVTERKIKEAENRRLVAQVNESQRMEAVGTLAAGVAHNFNNLLMSIQGFISLMFLDISENHSHYSRLKTIEDLIQRGADLTTKLLRYSRHGRYATEPVDMKDVLQAVTSDFQQRFNDVSVSFKVPESAWAVAADHKEIEQAFMNLLINAGEAMPGGGALSMTVENTLLKESFTASFGQKPGPYVKISIIDTGVGIDKQIIERIFEPFFSTKNISQGAGLGLASTHGIINNHGGIIQVQSEKELGTTFTIYWPALPAEDRLHADSTVLANGIRPSIMVVDDDAVIRNLLKKILTKQGYQVVLAEDGHKALDILRQDTEGIDLAIIDMVMPDMLGDQVVEAMRELAPNVKFILISGFPESEIVQTAMRDTRQAFLQKPVQPGTLSNTIRQLLEV